MVHVEYKTKRLENLKKGDIINMRIPFEENTNDYYNGYRPKEIRGRLYKDRNGDTSKPRMVIVIGHDDRNVMYLPLTSRHSGFDSKHQYMLQDNSMTYKKDPDMKSYVEVNSLRAVYANPEWNIQYIGEINENDMVNIMTQLGKREIDFESKRDQRAYVSRGRNEQFERRLQENGYTLSREELTEKTYTKEDGKTVTKSKWGLVFYHVPLSKEEVTQMVEKREGRPIGKHTKINYESKPEDDFTKAVADITEKTTNKESEVIQ